MSYVFILLHLNYNDNCKVIATLMRNSNLSGWLFVNLHCPHFSKNQRASYDVGTILSLSTMI